MNQLTPRAMFAVQLLISTVSSPEIRMPHYNEIQANEYASENAKPVHLPNAIPLLHAHNATIVVCYTRTPVQMQSPSYGLLCW